MTKRTLGARDVRGRRSDQRTRGGRGESPCGRGAGQRRQRPGLPPPQPRESDGAFRPRPGKATPKAAGPQVTAPAASRSPTPCPWQRQGDGEGWHLTCPVAGLVEEGRGRPGSTGRATGPRSVSSGPPHPNDKPLPRASEVANRRASSAYPAAAASGTRIAQRRRARDVIALAPPPAPAAAFSSAHSSTGERPPHPVPPRLSSLSLAHTQLGP